MEKSKTSDLKKLRAVLALSASLGGSVLTGCESTVIEDATEVYDVIDSTENGVEIPSQVLEVPGENFSLIVEYSLDSDTAKKWRITDDKKIYTKVYTKGLDEGVKVWIDNVHTDTTLVATKESMNGITQDSMDDRIHNSLMYGFPISDTTSYFAVNIIEGQNDTFISGSSYGFNGYSSGSVNERRHTESEYLEEGVYANKISSSYGLLIQKSNDLEPYGVDVSSDVVILVSPEIITEDDEKVYTYTYDRNGNYEKTEKKKKNK